MREAIGCEALGRSVPLDWPHHPPSATLKRPQSSLRHPPQPSSTHLSPASSPLAVLREAPGYQPVEICDEKEGDRCRGCVTSRRICAPGLYQFQISFGACTRQLLSVFVHRVKRSPSEGCQRLFFRRYETPHPHQRNSEFVRPPIGGCFIRHGPDVARLLDLGPCFI